MRIEEFDFLPPTGVNFSSVGELRSEELSNVLCRIVRYLDSNNCGETLRRYDDWLEHDGLHFYRRSVSIKEVVDVLCSSDSIAAAMPGDFNVFIGLADKNRRFYLRFYLDQDDTDTENSGRFDFTVAPDLEEIIEKELISKLNIPINKADAIKYFESIVD